MSQYKDPFYTVYNPAASTVQSYVQPQPAPQVSFVSHLNEQSLQAVRQIVREEVQQASTHLEKTTAHPMHEMYGMTYRGYSLQDLDKVIDFYLTHKGDVRNSDEYGGSPEFFVRVTEK